MEQKKKVSIHHIHQHTYSHSMYPLHKYHFEVQQFYFVLLNPLLYFHFSPYKFVLCGRKELHRTQKAQFDIMISEPIIIKISFSPASLALTS